MGKEWKQWLTLFFWALKITADGDCSYEIKRCLLLGRKVMTYLDSILKSRDTSLTAKVRLVKDMVFTVVMYGYECWTIKKWVLKNWCFWTVVLKKTIESPLDCKEIQPVHPKGDQSWVFIRRTDVEMKLQYFGHLMWRADSLEKSLMLRKIEGRRRRGWQRMRWLDGITDSMDMGLGWFREVVINREAWCAVVHGVTMSQTWLNDSNELNWTEVKDLGIRLIPSRIYLPRVNNCSWEIEMIRHPSINTSGRNMPKESMGYLAAEFKRKTWTPYIWWDINIYVMWF